MCSKSIRAAINDKAGAIAHEIIPEPENLVWCAQEMERLQAEGKRDAVLGYMPDCDGDRGNIVYWNEKQITPQMRQEAFDNYETTDDHAMQIVGLAKDQKGREYYIVKNSWGTSNDNKGYLYVSKNYVRYKTMNIIVNQKGTPKDLVRKFKKAPYIS